MKLQELYPRFPVVTSLVSSFVGAMVAVSITRFLDRAGTNNLWQFGIMFFILFLLSLSYAWIIKYRKDKNGRLDH
jgi:hypothetical protein